MWIIVLILCSVSLVTGGDGAFGNRPPSLGDSKYHFINENHPVGTEMFVIKASDRDSKTITFSIKQKNLETFNLVTLGQSTVTVTGDGCKATVPVILKKTLDRDYEPEDRTLRITISDGINSIVGIITITIMDVNDVSPSFRNLPYRATIREDAQPQSLVFNNTAVVDPDTTFYGNRYSMKALEQAFQKRYEDLFRIDSITGYVYLNGSLDYEQNTFYQFSIIVEEIRNKNLSASAELIVTVVDVQDTAPSFLNQPYMKTIQENISVGDTVITVSALDGDHGVPNDIKYYFQPPETNFRIDNVTGVIRVNKELDIDVAEIRDRGNVFDLTVVAEEVNSTYPSGTHITVTTHVTVTVSDVNDNAPTFSRPNYSGTVIEEMMEDIPVTFARDNKIIVSDKDQGANSKFRVSLWKDGQPFTVFRPTPENVRNMAEIQILIQNSSALDYETLTKDGGNPLVFEILAREMDTAEQLSSLVTVSVTVTDRNDNYPQFTQASYVAHVKENSKDYTRVIQVNATDKDSGLFGKVTYSFRGDTQKFGINSTTGEIYVAGPLDREVMSVYYLSVEAKDGGNIGTSTQLTIYVDDVNDETPKFQRGNYEGYIRESSTFLLRPVVVKADDGDLKGTNNSIVKYSFKTLPAGLESNFSINSSSGEIQVVGSLDYEKLAGSGAKVTPLELVVAAHDMGEPMLSSTCIVYITVEDINDNDPVFVKSSYHVSIDENAAPESLVETVSARDDDGDPPNNEVIYRIQTGALDKFRIDANSGEITVEIGATFDRDVRPSYEVTVVASDKGTPPRSSSCTVNITLNDVNNKPPRFEAIVRDVMVREDAGEGTFVVRASATDPDHDPSFVFALVGNLTRGFDVGMSPVKNQSLVEDYFKINSTTGDIRVKSSLDRELADIVTVVVTVEDTNSINGQQITTGTVTITLLDVNDNGPHFTQSVYYVNVSENVIKDVITVRATDADRDTSISYRIWGHTPFIIDEKTGIVSIKTRLDREVTSVHNITVTADDNGRPESYMDIAYVVVNVLDLNDNPPAFVEDNVVRNIPEDEDVGNVVVTINATDNDVGEFGRVVYSIQSGNENGSFILAPDSGRLEVAKKLDRETWPVYTIRIEAKDNPAGTPNAQNLKYTDVTINIDDVNDNTPRFPKDSYHLQEAILENVGLDSNVFEVTASDGDLGQNKELVYELVDAKTNASGLFNIDSGTGLITVAKSLEGLYGVFYLTVRVSDKGQNSLSSEYTLWLDIKDVNTHSPKFAESELRIYMQEFNDSDTTTDPRGVIVATVTATDNDRGDNGRVRYQFDNTTRGDYMSFNIDPDTGVIRLIVRLDYETKRLYRATIIASDYGTPPLAPARLPFILEVTDSDDNPPVFPHDQSHQPFILTSLEERPPPALVGSVALATDQDTGNNSKICYCLVGSNPNFMLDQQSGNLSLLRAIDRETLVRPSMSVVVKARQSCEPCTDPKRSKRSVPDISPAVDVSDIPPQYDKTDPSLLWVRVNILDENDNPPRLKYNTSTLAVGITRDTQKYSVIFDLRQSITDDDSDSNSVHRYSLKKMTMSASLKKNFKDNNHKGEPFSLLADGRLRTEMYFQKDMSGYFIVTFTASDDGGSLTDDIYISLVNNEQRVRIVIRGTPDKVGLVKDIIAKKLSEVTKFTIIVDKIQTHEDITGTEQTHKTDMFIHAEHPNTKKVVPADVLTRKIDDNIHLLTQFYNDYNIIDVGPSSPAKDIVDKEKPYKMALILVTVILVVILIAVIALFVTRYRKYKQRLKEASNIFGNNTNYIDSQLKLDLPGTNLHTTEASNPVWQKEYDNAAMHIESEGDDNSLDENEIEQKTGAEHYNEQEINMNMFSDEPDSPTQVISSGQPRSYAPTNLHAHDLAARQNNNVTTSSYNNGSSKIGNGYANGKYVVNTYNLETTEI